MSLDWHHSKFMSQESLGSGVQVPLLFSSLHLLTKPELSLYFQLLLLKNVVLSDLR